MMFVCLDVEGVLLPEIWLEIAQATGIEALSLTTRDQPDFGVLMQHRIRILREHQVSWRDLKQIAERVEPLPGARKFLDAVRSCWPCVLISDSFYEFLQPLAPSLGLPTIFCHRLHIGEDGMLDGWRPRQDNQKPKVVNSLQNLGFTVVAAGDSFNDLAMLDAADFSFFVNAPAHISERVPQRKSCNGLVELLDALRAIPTCGGPDLASVL